MRDDQTSTKSSEFPTPAEGDPGVPAEGENGGNQPRTEPGNPGVDPNRIEMTEEDLERTGK